MKTNPPPILSVETASFDTYDADDSEDIIGQVKALIDGTHPGVLTTVDPAGKPHARWMATLSLEKLPYLYSLTSDRSRKIDDIEGNPAVNWMFSSSDLSLVVNLCGTARVCRDTMSLILAWRQIKDKSHAYFLKNYTEGSGCVVLETHIDAIECCTPKNAMKFRVDIGALRS